MKKRRRTEPYAEGEDVIELALEDYAPDMAEQGISSKTSLLNEPERQRWVYHKRMDEPQDY